MSRYRVLVVDDDVSIRMLLTAALEQEELDVQTAPDGSSALALGLTCAFDLFLLDYLLPNMRGLDLALALRRHHPDAPIALITGTPHLVSEADLAAAGIARLFAKPFHLNELVAWIHTQLPSTC
jgi:DNA-binding response OmpR family regulator